MYKIDIRIWRRRVASRLDRLKLRFVKWLVKPWFEIRITEDLDYGKAGFNDVKSDGESAIKEHDGRVVKVKMKKQYDPFEDRKGGRVVKRMPRHIKEVKEGQDAVPEVPVED